ncbi:hypothetical protein MPTK1_2g20320 [Marchantia polymorpha subsp. ruderalis]|uniref:PA domain-containing protein n=1 Tax=Marchantia polymorpha TaxID=3197 RepID=A0A2R6WV56_MARPO|nr:hypothetical protein MARPO_0055s0017 [Marchantia polymorpha]BBN03056.1 hypothetical protein Mp_2g20320 [Marchantia polymorpha subsp. ruderalis]|eukprot:PTQ37729.1 hypothetical protein MARPO_0055s0017 [Marchantia polymorpha]
MSFLLRLLLGCSIALLLVAEGRATVVLFGNDTTSFPSMDSATTFTPRIPDGGIEGVLYTADPLEACSDLSVNVTGTTSFALVMRGNCTFEQKIRNCQNAGFTAVIIFNNKDTNELVSMAGDGSKIHIYGIFITKEAGESLLGVQGPCYLLPGYEKKTWAIKWLILSVSLIVIVIVAALVTALCCIRQHILAEAEADTLNNVLNQKLLDEEIMTREFRPDDMGPDVLSAEALGAQDVMTDVEGDEGGASDSDHASDMSIPSIPK